MPAIGDLFWNRHVRMVLRVALGWVCIVIGVAGIFLPIVPGVLFIAVGVALLARHVLLFARLRDWIYHRSPASRKYVNRVRARMYRFSRRGGRGKGPPPGRGPPPEKG